MIVFTGGGPGGIENFRQFLRLRPQGGEVFGWEQSGLPGQFQPETRISSASSKTMVILLTKSARDLARKAAR